MSIRLTRGHEPLPSRLPFDVRPQHCGLSVPELEASIAWYREMLGFEPRM